MTTTGYKMHNEDGTLKNEYVIWATESLPVLKTAECELRTAIRLISRNHSRLNGENVNGIYCHETERFIHPLNTARSDVSDMLHIVEREIKVREVMLDAHREALLHRGDRCYRGDESLDITGEDPELVALKYIMSR